VAATLSPRLSAASAQTRPKPLEVPVMNQIFCDMCFSFFDSIGNAAVYQGWFVFDSDKLK
jgi:hypothetical protein